MKNLKLIHLKKVFSIGVLIFAFNNTQAQQHIQNAGFESTTNVVIHRQNSALWNPNTFPSPWTRGNGGTPDIFSDNAYACGSSNPNNAPCFPEVCVYDNAFGNQYPRTHTLAADGNTFANYNYAMLYIPSEYIHQQLQYSLTAGSCYTLSFWVSRADVCTQAIPLQAVISTTDMTTTSTAMLTPPSNSIVLTTDHPIVNKTGWEKVTFSFKAIETGVTYITIGCFDFDLAVESSGDALDCGDENSSCGTDCYHLGLQESVVMYFIDDVSLVPDGGSFTVPSGQALTGGTTTTNYASTNLLITGNVTISGNVTWYDCDVRCNNRATITIGSGSSLTLSGGTVLSAGCDMMWDGIIVNGTGKILVTSSTIEDAITAIILNGTSEWEISGTSTNLSYFNKNATDIIVNSTSTTSTNKMKYSVFDHSVALRDPSQGVAGFGITGIVFNATTNNNTELVGGTSTGEGCVFIGGQYGIRSTNRNLNVKRSLFMGNIKQVAIDFQGNNSTVFRSLAVTNASTFMECKRHILSQHRTNLTVQASAFYYAKEHSIEWSDNHDGQLLIGDVADNTKGNTFTDNAWTAVTAWDNKSAQTNKTTLATNNNGNSVYTSILIGENTISCQPYAGAFLIGEWALGSDVSYHELEISQNNITGVLKGIQLYNINGWSGAFAIEPSAFTLPKTEVYYNGITISTAMSPTAFGINGDNALGLHYRNNAIGSNNPSNWQNTGIRLQNSNFSQVHDNLIYAGTGVSAGLYMNFSGIYCNLLEDNRSGITLGWAALCYGTGYSHGSIIQGYSNTFFNQHAGSIDIHNYYSNVTYNDWVWDGGITSTFPVVLYSGVTPAVNQASGSLFSTSEGTTICPYGYQWRAAGPNVDATMGDANMQWRADYTYELQRLLTDSGSSSVASANIKLIIGIEDNIGAGNYGDALTALGSLTPANDIEENYKAVLTVFADINYPTKREPTTTEIATLTAVAEQFERTGGAAVTLARTYFAVKYNTYFKDEMFTDGVSYGLAETVSPCSIGAISGTQLGFMDDNGNDLPFYAVVESNGDFAFDPYDLTYYSGLYEDTEYRIYAKHGSTFTVVNQNFNTLAEWISASPIHIDLAGVSIEIDTITTEEYQAIDNYTQVVDGASNVYTVGVTSGENTDFLIEKHSSHEDLIWSLTYDGPTSERDTATCITIDSEDNIYVAGKVFNGLSYDYQVLKYNSDGLLIWEAYIADSLKKDNTPTGIMVDEYGSVSITGTCITDTSSEFHFVKFWQCLPSIGERQAQPQVETTQVSSIELYPNPSDGKITIIMKDQTAGTLELFDLAGQSVFSQQITQSGEVILPAEKVANGVYLLKFTGTGNPQFKKLVIQRN